MENMNNMNTMGNFNNTNNTSNMNNINNMGNMSNMNNMYNLNNTNNMYNNYNQDLIQNNNNNNSGYGNMNNDYNSCNCNNNQYPIDREVEPLAVNIEQATLQNRNFRTVLWTGEHLQVTLMCISAGESIGLEVHQNADQFLKIEQGVCCVEIGDSRNNLNFQTRASRNCAICIPAGKWHNITNIGNIPLKLYSIYAPPQHQRGTVNRTNTEY